MALFAKFLMVLDRQQLAGRRADRLSAIHQKLSEQSSTDNVFDFHVEMLRR